MKYYLLLLLLISSVLIRLSAQSNLVYSDKIYDPQIKTVQLYPDDGGPQDYQRPAVNALGQPPLVLEFDDLLGNRSNLYVKVIHCNYDWTKSTLMDLDYLNDYNEYPINDYTFSGGTHLAYIHYRFQMPAVKLAGNYLAIVYRDDPSHLIISRRMMVNAPVINIIQDRQLAGTGALSLTQQPINFILDYSKVEILNPMENIHVVIRQNQRWDNARIDVRPSFVRDADSQLEYHFFDNDKSFAGGNEFRFVDFRSLNYPGQNTGTINRGVKPYQLSVLEDQPRTDQAYAQFADLDGNYIIDNLDTGDPKTNSNYLPVTFTLNAGQEIKAPVYITGAFNFWDHNDESLMKYNTSKGRYQATVMLKQGLYNYQYFVDSKTLPPNYIEGDHFETENLYEVFVYNRAFRPNADMLIGYFVLQINQR
jgi:Domain of unknown function (DUF5103)